jgi:hypothetical protein
MKRFLSNLRDPIFVFLLCGALFLLGVLGAGIHRAFNPPPDVTYARDVTTGICYAMEGGNTTCVPCDSLAHVEVEQWNQHVEKR